MKRVFLALHFKENHIISQYINVLRSELMAENIQWVEPQNLHLTLKFFGPTEDLLISRIGKQLDFVLKNQKSFTLSFNKLGIFGSKYQPRVLWMGLENAEELLKISETINRALEEIGILTNRQNFVPHLTIGRIKKLHSKRYFQSVINCYNVFQMNEMLIDRVFLYESISKKSGVEYRVLKEYVFQA